MSHATDEALRRAVRGLADEARPVTNLAPIAMARGQRVRRRRRAVGVAATVAVIGALTAPFVWLRPGPGPELATPTGGVAPVNGYPGAPAEPPPGAGAPWTYVPLPLSDKLMVVGGTTTGSPGGRPYVFDRTRNQYVTFSEYDEIWAAPRGNFAAAYDYSRPEETGLLDVPTGAVTWVPTGNHRMHPQWSPDGRLLLLTLPTKGSTGGYTAVIVTAADGRARRFGVDGQKFPCTEYCQFTWMPDGNEIAFPQDDPSRARQPDGRPPRRGLQLFSADEVRPTRLLPIRGDVDGTYSWSPDGQLAVVQAERDVQLTTVSTGAVVGTLTRADAHWLTDDRLMYLTTDRERQVATETDLKGKKVREVPLPVELTGRLLFVGAR
ncbi:TolB family protein [Micromonospora sp. NPDC050417]|uniref:TolB family protein n=1 Tax=Micromonospora sp. NPDC050417 TaxID=3364280 RepID=UPI0037893307